MTKNSEYLYRIVRFEFLYDIFESSELFFARPQSWEDPYELRIDHPAMHDVFAQCWCRRGVSDAMWRIYSPSHTGVRIKVRRSELREQLAAARSTIKLDGIKIADVKYHPQQIIDQKHSDLVNDLNANYQPRKALNSLMYKRMAFDHEAETRVLLYIQGINKDAPGVRIPVEPHDLIETVLGDPRMPESIFKTFKYYVTKKFGYGRSFRRSSIYSVREPMRVGFDDDES